MSETIKPSIKQAKTGGVPLPVDFNKSDFEALIEDKGYDCIIEKAIHCPCRGHEGGHQPQSSCKNCGGSGWLYINRIETKLVLQSMNAQVKNSEWSKEKLGMVKITAKDADKLGESDRVTVLSGESYYTESFLTKFTDDGVEFSLLSYPCVSVDVVFMFKDSLTKNVQLVEDVDFTIVDNVFKMTDKWKSSITYDNAGEPNGKSISMRYKHRPVYHVLDIPRDTMLTDIFVDETFSKPSFQMPIHAIGRRAHYIVGFGGLNGSELFDNSTISYEPS